MSADAPQGKRPTKELIPAQLDDADLTAQEFRVLCHISRCDGRMHCFQKLANMAWACRVEIKTLKRAIKSLLAYNMIWKQERDGDTSVFGVRQMSKWTVPKRPERKEVDQKTPGVGRPKNPLGGGPKNTRGVRAQKHDSAHILKAETPPEVKAKGISSMGISQKGISEGSGCPHGNADIAYPSGRKDAKKRTQGGKLSDTKIRALGVEQGIDSSKVEELIDDIRAGRVSRSRKLVHGRFGVIEDCTGRAFDN